MGSEFEKLKVKKAAILYSDAKRKYFATKDQYLTEANAKKEAEVVAKYLKKIGIETDLIAANAKLVGKLKRSKPQIVFNMVGSIKGNEYLASSIPGILELLEIPYTGTGILGEALSYNKFIVKKMLHQAEIPVPIFQLFSSHSDFLDPALRFPLISKLNEIHGGVEITKDAVSLNEKHLRERIKYLIKTYNQPVLVEEFIVGKEVVGILLEGQNKKVYLAEKEFKNSDKNIFEFQTFEDQWNDENDERIQYKKYDDNALKELIKKAFSVLKMTDYAKFDIRIDYSGRYYFIDSNSNPAFGPKELNCAISSILDLYDIPFLEILKRLIINTLQ